MRKRYKTGTFNVKNLASTGKEYYGKHHLPVIFYFKETLL